METGGGNGHLVEPRLGIGSALRQTREAEKRAAIEPDRAVQRSERRIRKFLFDDTSRRKQEYRGLQRIVETRGVNNGCDAIAGRGPRHGLADLRVGLGDDGLLIAGIGGLGDDDGFDAGAL